MAVKDSFADVYGAPNPAPYYRSYVATRLSIVEYAAALARTVVDLKLADGPVVDLGSGYGALGVLLRTNLDIEGTYATYLGGREPTLPGRVDYVPAIVGVDRSTPALLAAERARFVDRGVTMDLNSPQFDGPEFGPDAFVVCTAVLGYVRPEALRRALDALRPRLAIVTCVTWLASEFSQAFQGRGYEIVKLNRLPLFQRWATTGERSRMATALIEGAHRAECFLLSPGPLPSDALGEQVERVRARRAASAWLAAGRPGGCELLEGPRA